MIWEPDGEFRLRCGEWSISRAKVGDDSRYLLWRGDGLVDGFDTAELAKKEAEKWTKK